MFLSLPFDLVYLLDTFLDSVLFSPFLKRACQCSLPHSSLLSAADLKSMLYFYCSLSLVPYVAERWLFCPEMIVACSLLLQLVL